MQLPTQKTPARNLVSDLSVLIHGKPKIGKSTWCSGAEKALFLATEPGLNSLDVYQQPITSWEEMMEMCQLIAAGKHEFKTIIIDTIDNAFKLCSKYVCEKHNVEHESDLDYGKGYAYVNNEFQRAIVKMAYLPYGLYLISHSQDKEIKTRTGKYTKVIPTLPDKASKIITGMVDIILYCDLVSEKNENDEVIAKRVTKTTPSLYYEAGNRVGLPETIDLNYQNFLVEFQKLDKNKKGGNKKLTSTLVETETPKKEGKKEEKKKTAKKS